MRKSLLAIALIGALVSFSPTPSHACKPAYCQSALRSCVQSCRESYNGYPGMAEGCMTGCNIGYLFC
jgi:hypothetical protein